MTITFESRVDRRVPDGAEPCQRGIDQSDQEHPSRRGADEMARSQKFGRGKQGESWRDPLHSSTVAKRQSGARRPPISDAQIPALETFETGAVGLGSA
jgi:hypothetical protein